MARMCPWVRQQPAWCPQMLLLLLLLLAARALELQDPASCYVLCINGAIEKPLCIQGEALCDSLATFRPSFRLTSSTV